MKLKFSDILPNPYRDLKSNPLDPRTVTRLRRSINATGFWDNCVVRKHPTLKGKYEQAYGHNRKEAALLEGIKEADFIVKVLTDEQMIQIMHDDNDEAYKFKTASLFESVRAVVNALAAGKIGPFKIPKDTPKSKIRYAPSFVPGKEPSSDSDIRPYTVMDVARLLHETKDNGTQATSAIKAVVNALHLIEIGQLKEASLLGLPLDSPMNGLIQTVQATYSRLADEEQRAKVMQEQMKREQERKSEAQKAQIASTQKRMTKVRAEETKDVKKPTLADPGPSLDAKLATKKEQAKQNAANIATKGPELEAKLATKVTVDPKEVERNNAANSLRQRIDAMVKARLDLLAITNKEVLSNELAYLWKNVQDTIQRKRIFDALNNVSTYFDEWARRFPGKPPRQSAKDMLSEEYKKEEAKRRKEENAE